MPRGAFAFLVVTLAVLAIPSPARAADGDGDGIDDADEDSLIATYAPYLHFHSEERYLPVSVQFALDHSALERFSYTGLPVLVDDTPTAAELATYDVPADPVTNPNDVYYLNNTRGTIRDESGIASAYATGSYAKTVYARVANDAGFTVVQFWFYYAYNPGIWNNHEGDWEMVSVLLQGGTPVAVGFSQHEGGERMAWADADREGTHPKVYVARGSHANYVRPYQGRLGIAGDVVSDAGPVWRPADYEAVNVGERDAPSAGNEWLRFAGRWGEFFLQAEARGEAGPRGPAYREDGAMFATPAQWANALPVPSNTLLLLNWFLANLLTLFVVLLLVSFALKVLRLWRLQRKTKAGWKLWPLAHLLPFDRKSVAMVLALVALAIGIGGFLLPWYTVTVDVDAPGFFVTDGPEELLRVDGVDGLTINPLRPDGGVVRANVLSLPMGIVLAALSGYFLVRIAGTKTARRLGGRFVARGILAVLPFVFVLLLAALALPALPEDNPGELGVADFLRPIAASPFGGTNTIAVEGGSATVVWGLAIGSWLLIASALLMFVAGAIALTQTYAFLPLWYVAGFASPEEAAAAAAPPVGEAPPAPPPLEPAEPPGPPEPPEPPASP